MWRCLGQVSNHFRQTVRAVSGALRRVPQLSQKGARMVGSRTATFLNVEGLLIPPQGS